ncbi:Zinc finger BED domain-containing protein RICESLEEPER 2 [Euphorbia peplus]|nr:Zinc finger BED domain-containing protein RICESLEEPER 2 [Euphorbia peplus]
MKPRAKVWGHFTKFTDEEGNIKGKCNYCEKDFHCDPYKNGNTAMNTHMRACRKNPRSIQTRQTQLALQPMMTLGNGETDVGCLSTWKFDQQACRESLAVMIIIDELPFKFVENEGYRKHMAIAQPRFKIPSRTTVARDVYQLYLNEKTRLREYFVSSKQRISITTDTWTSIQRINYMCITSHYIDSEWKLQKKILNFCTISSHKGDAIGKAVESCLLEWGISGVFTVTVDNSISNDTAIAYLKKKFVNWEGCIGNCKYLHMRCIAHILNLVVVEGLKELIEPIKKIRNVVRYIRQSPARLKKFKECIEAEKIPDKNLLCLDVCTRWNSTYLMLDTAQKFEKAFERYESDHDPFYIIELNADEGVPLSNDWDVVRSLCVMLK